MASQVLPAMAGRALPDAGINPATLYGLPAGMGAPPPTGPMSSPGGVVGGAPSSPMPAPAPSAPSAPSPIPSTMPLHGQVPGAGSMPGVYSGVSSTAPTTVGPNAFGVHPGVDLHQITDYLLPKVRNVESGGNYKADRSQTHPGQTASGAYQYIDSTWNGFGGFKRAVDAPPEVQDQKAKADFMDRLKTYGNDPFKAVAGHYFPRFAHDPSKWNDPLSDAHGNAIQGSEPVAKYLSRVLPPERVQAYLAAQGSGA